MTFLVELGAGIAAHLVEQQVVRSTAPILQFGRDAVERLKDGSLGVFIFGPQGTGKTTVLGILAGTRSINDLPSEYVASPKTEAARYQGHLFFKAYAGPGQPGLSDVHWPDLYRKIGRYDRVLCIYCASYGHHAIFEEDFDILRQSSMNKSDGAVVTEYLEGRRHAESDLFTQFSQELCGVSGKIGLMLLVTKQDLWWHERHLVESHYKRGAYASGFRRLGEAKKAVGFVSARQSASLSLQNLVTSDRKVLVPTTSGYDQLLQRVNYGALVKKLEEIVGLLAEN